MKCALTTLALLLTMTLTLSCDGLTKRMPISAATPDVSIDVNEPAPFAGVLVPRPRYDKLRKMEGFYHRNK